MAGAGAGSLSEQAFLQMGVSPEVASLLAAGVSFAVAYKLGKYNYGKWAEVGQNNIYKSMYKELTQNWEYPPSFDDFSKNYKTFTNSDYYDQITGNPKYPPYNGFKEANPPDVTISKGTILKRTGGEGGNYLTNVDVPVEEISLAVHSRSQPVHYYQFNEDYIAKGGVAAPWFNQPGGGYQYMTDWNIEKLLNEGIIIEVFP